MYIHQAWPKYIIKHGQQKHPYNQLHNEKEKKKEENKAQNKKSKKDKKNVQI